MCLPSVKTQQMALLRIIGIASTFLSGCAYNSPSAMVTTRTNINVSLMPPTEQLLTTNAR